MLVLESSSNGDGLTSNDDEVELSLSWDCHGDIGRDFSNKFVFVIVLS